MTAPTLDISTMRRGASDATRMLRSLAHDERLLILCQLTQGEMSVGALQQALALEQPMLSQQLAVLRRERLVTTRRSGRFVHYRIVDPNVLALLETLYQLFCPQPTPSED